MKKAQQILIGHDNGDIHNHKKSNYVKYCICDNKGNLCKLKIQVTGLLVFIKK